MKLAVIKTGGKQYLAQEGAELKIEKLPQAAGKEFIFDQVLIAAGENGKDLKIGQPLIGGVKVKAKILEQGWAKKIRVVKYKPKTRYHKVYGHRQPFTKVKIEKIS